MNARSLTLVINSGLNRVQWSIVIRKTRTLVANCYFRTRPLSGIVIISKPLSLLSGCCSFIRLWQWDSPQIDTRRDRARMKGFARRPWCDVTLPAVAGLPRLVRESPWWRQSTCLPTRRPHYFRRVAAPGQSATAVVPHASGSTAGGFPAMTSLRRRLRANTNASLTQFLSNFFKLFPS